MPTFETVIKSQGVVAFSKAVAACGRCDGVTEHDFTAAVTDYAKAQAPARRVLSQSLRPRLCRRR